MPITFFCSTCGRKLTARDEGAGKTGNCPGCQTPFTVPPPSAPSVIEPKPPVPLKQAQNHESPTTDEEQPSSWHISWEQVLRTIKEHWQWIGLGIACFVMFLGAWIWLPDVIRKIILERFPVMSIIGFLATITFVLLILWRKNKPLFWIVLTGLGLLVFAPTIKRCIWPPDTNVSDGSNASNSRKPARNWIGFGFWGTVLVGYLHNKGYLDSFFPYISQLIEAVKSFFQG